MTVFPAQAGVILAGILRFPEVSGLSRASGGDPMLVAPDEKNDMSFPRKRG